MFYITGDIHRNILHIFRLCKEVKPTADDVVILLGDVGANYCLDGKDTNFKFHISKFPPTFFCIHGNHECRPQNVKGYKEKIWNGGKVLYQKDFPNLLFPVDGEIFDLDGLKCIVIGGAYSVDKHFRLEQGIHWFEDEQPSDEIKRKVLDQLRNNKVDVVFSHTCPQKYTPTECFLPGIDQSTVDSSTEEWLDTIEDKLDYKAWYCGHWHTNKHIDKMHFLFHDVEILGNFN